MWEGELMAEGRVDEDTGSQGGAGPGVGGVGQGISGPRTHPPPFVLAASGTAGLWVTNLGC